MVKGVAERQLFICTQVAACLSRRGTVFRVSKWTGMCHQRTGDWSPIVLRIVSQTLRANGSEGAL